MAASLIVSIDDRYPPISVDDVSVCEDVDNSGL